MLKKLKNKQKIFLLVGYYNYFLVVTAVQCLTPENPKNGRAIYTSCSYNSVVSYECRYGFTLVGESSRRCGADRKWSGGIPVCKGKNKFN